MAMMFVAMVMIMVAMGIISDEKTSRPGSR